MPKARRLLECECCKRSIHTGSVYVTFAGRPWIPQHLIAYRERRRAMIHG